MTRPSSGKHVLMTVDAVGGVWSYASCLARELETRGWSITLLTLGPAPRQDQFMPLLPHDGIDLQITDLELEWQDPEGRDRRRVLAYLAALEDTLRPDIVHLNGYREACAGWRAPVVLAAHSCVGSWWRSCRGEAPEAGWGDYLADVAAGLDAADRWVAPTAAFRDSIARLYQPQREGEVIWNGIAPLPEPPAKEDFILAAGRLWDEAKNVGLLPVIAKGLDCPVRVAGPLQRSDGAPVSPQAGVEWLGDLPQGELLGWMGKAGIFVSPAVYEPFGLTVLEAAASGCALVLADIPSFRELWDGAALFVNPRDPGAVQAALNTLSRNPVLRSQLQRAARRRSARYGIAAQADAYERLYQQMLEGRPRLASVRLPLAEARV
jgi:glycosyltransferase involved in cell wall biosynthesis